MIYKGQRRYRCKASNQTPRTGVQVPTQEKLMKLTSYKQNSQ